MPPKLRSLPCRSIPSSKAEPNESAQRQGQLRGYREPQLVRPGQPYQQHGPGQRGQQQYAEKFHFARLSGPHPVHPKSFAECPRKYPQQEPHGERPLTHDSGSRGNGHARVHEQFRLRPPHAGSLQHRTLRNLSSRTYAPSVPQDTPRYTPRQVGQRRSLTLRWQSVNVR
ncbi:hypothetical protein SGPA1_70014 [Streptomyces misionensis JCM 4497]